MPQKLRCRVTEILEHGDQVYSVFLKPEKPAPHFLPGQFLHLALDKYDQGDFWPDSRPFSIASAPFDRQSLRITYAVKGHFTGRMQSELHPGGEVWVKMPYGDFVIDSDNDVCLLAGGTGVTAFTAFIAALQADCIRRIYLFYGARCPDLLIYRPLVEAAEQRCSNLHGWFLAEQDIMGTDCLLGLIDSETVSTFIPDPLQVMYYLAGPPQMINSLTFGLIKLGVEQHRIIADAWE